MVTEKAGGYISRLEFNTGESLDIKQNDIVVFVGPNNAGKSQSLKDIYTLSSKKYQLLLSLILRLLKVKNHFCLYYRAFQAEMIKAHTRIILFLGMVSIIGKNLPIVHF